MIILEYEHVYNHPEISSRILCIYIYIITLKYEHIYIYTYSVFLNQIESP